MINAFCYECKAPRSVDWTTGNKSLDSFIMESWSNVKNKYGHGLCLTCTWPLEPKINLFCFYCKALRLRDWTTGNKSLDSFIMESWSNVYDMYDASIQWIEYSLLMNVREMTSLRHGCTHTAEWITNELTRVTLKKIVDEQNDQLFDFHQVNYFTYVSHV